MQIWILTFVLNMPTGSATVESYYKEKKQCEAKLQEVMSRHNNGTLLRASCTLSISL
jgi:hypothetical protein